MLVFSDPPAAGRRMTASNFLRMRPFTKTLITIVLVSVPACLLVLALAARTQDSLPLNARYEDSTSGLILLTFCFCTALVLMVRLLLPALRCYQRSWQRYRQIV